MSDRRPLGIGLGGSALAAVCCFTPLLPVLLAAIGLSAWLEVVVLPALVLFLGITAYALLQRRKA